MRQRLPLRYKPLYGFAPWESSLRNIAARRRAAGGRHLCWLRPAQNATPASFARGPAPGTAKWYSPPRPRASKEISPVVKSRFAERRIPFANAVAPTTSPKAISPASRRSIASSTRLATGAFSTTSLRFPMGASSCFRRVGTCCASNGSTTSISTTPRRSQACRCRCGISLVTPAMSASRRRTSTWIRMPIAASG